MRYFLIVIGLLSFFAASGQDSLTCIKPSTARYFLEADDERWVLREKDSLNTQLILNQKEEILVRDSIITSYKLDSSSYETAIETLLQSNQEQVSDLTRQLKSQKRTKFFLIVSIIGVLLLK